MITAFTSFLRVYELAFRSLGRAATTSLVVLVGCTSIMLSSCSKEPASRDAVDSIALVDTGHGVATAIIRQLRDSAGLLVRSVSLARNRIDITVQPKQPKSDPDTEYRSFSAIAERIWASGFIESRAETVAVIALHGSVVSGLLERNTYFYYRSERSVKKDR